MRKRCYLAELSHVVRYLRSQLLAELKEAEKEKTRKTEEARVKKFEAEKEKNRKLDEKLDVERRELIERDKDKAKKAEEQFLEYPGNDPAWNGENARSL